MSAPICDRAVNPVLITTRPAEPKSALPVSRRKLPLLAALSPVRREMEPVFPEDEVPVAIRMFPLRSDEAPVNKLKLPPFCFP